MKETRPLSCACGRVQGEADVSHALSIVCYCNSCTGYCEWIQTKATLPPPHESECRPVGSQVEQDPWGGVHYLVTYKADVRITAGHEFLRQTVWNEGSTNIRYGATCCGTPMWDTGTFPLIILCAHTLGKDHGIPVKRRIHHAGACERGTPIPPDIKPRPSSGWGFTLAKFAKRVMFAGGRGSPSPITLKEPHLQPDET